MADKIVHHIHEDGNKSNMSFLIGFIVLIIFVFLFIIYILPALGGMFQSPQVTVPDQIDVNVNQPEGQ